MIVSYNGHKSQVRRSVRSDGNSYSQLETAVKANIIFCKPVYERHVLLVGQSGKELYRTLADFNVVVKLAIILSRKTVA